MARNDCEGISEKKLLRLKVLKGDALRRNVLHSWSTGYFLREALCIDSINVPVLNRLRLLRLKEMVRTERAEPGAIAG